MWNIAKFNHVEISWSNLNVRVFAAFEPYWFLQVTQPYVLGTVFKLSLQIHLVKSVIHTLALVVGISLVAIYTDTHLCEVDMHTFLVRGTRCAATVDAVLCASGAGPACLTHTP